MLILQGIVVSMILFHAIPLRYLFTINKNIVNKMQSPNLNQHGFGTYNGKEKHTSGRDSIRKKTAYSPFNIRWCCQLTDLVYDGVFEVLQWLLFLSAVPPVQLLTGWCVTAKALPDISAISALTAVKHGNCSSLTPLLNPVRTRKSLIWPWMALDAGQPPALWALASTRFSAI